MAAFLPRALAALALAGARAERLAFEPWGQDAVELGREPSSDDHLFDELLEFLGESEAAAVPQGDAVTACRPVAPGTPLRLCDEHLEPTMLEDGEDECLRQDLHDKIAGLGPGPLRALAKSYIPEVALDARYSITTVSRHLTRAVMSAAPAEKAHDLLSLQGEGLVRAVCQWLGARLESMPWLPLLRRMPYHGMARLAARLGVDGSGATDRRRLVAKIVVAAWEDDALRQSLLSELSGMPELPAEGRAPQCPEFGRAELAPSGRTHPAQGDAPSLVYARLARRVEEALLILGRGAVLRMVQDYVPEMSGPRSSARQLGSRLIKLLSVAVPPDAAHKMMAFDDDDLVDELRHWLGTRLEQMPCVGRLRQMTSKQLRSLMAKLGIEMIVSPHRRRLVAKILAATAWDTAMRAALHRELAVIGGGAGGRARERPGSA